MDTEPLILLVEDDEFSALIVKEVLSPHFKIHHVVNGNDALTFLESKSPKLILLDVLLPDISGHDVCKAIRNNPCFSELPIIFLSGKTSEQERLSGYEAGGDDYLIKPIAIHELRYKIDLCLKNIAQRIHLKADLANTFATAMTAMTSAAEVGTVLNFLRNSFYCQNYDELCQEVINTMHNFDLEGCVLIRGQLGTSSLSTHGVCTPLEESVLNHMFGHDRLFQLSSSLSCSYDHVTLVNKNLDLNDQDRIGRMRDNIAMLAEGANVRVVSLDANADIYQKQQSLLRVIDGTSKALKSIEQQQRQHRLESDKLFQDLQVSFDKRMISMGLTEAQEEELALLVHQTGERALKLFDESESTEKYMLEIQQDLQLYTN